MSSLAPSLGDNEKPLVSVFIHAKHYAPYFRECLDSIYSQTYGNIEIIFFDSSSTSSSWNIALEYAARYPGTMTMGRNRVDIDVRSEREKKKRHDDVSHFRDAATGSYIIDLDPGDIIGPTYVNDYIAAKMNAFHDPNVPLVSVFIYNYNYGRFLRQCLDSVFAQTYKNIEILFSDNDSTDDSWSIATEYAARYPGTMTVMRNRKNLGPQSNSANCYRMAKGKYFVLLCSDDAFMPGFVEQCVNAMETSKTAKFALVHRHIMDDQGNVTEEPPFYNQSCIIPGGEQAAVYMMAGINPSLSQVMYNFDLAVSHTLTRGLVERWLSYRILDFNLCLKSDLVYIKEPLILHRMHDWSETSAIDSSLIQVLAQYVFVHQCADVASTNDFTKAANRLPEAVKKLGTLSLRYCARMLAAKDEGTARKYFHLSQAFAPEVVQTENYRMIHEYWRADDNEKEKILRSLNGSDGLVARTVAYDPPPGSVPLDLQSAVHKGPQ